ncbi:tautomerase family protein [Maricurvus nonylphenolicus]|uniref:hypothetical protein n=1 Tax=Maricurvus nonylphenolicus TaxID=1008307 RepID=UPI0036F2F4ED
MPLYNISSRTRLPESVQKQVAQKVVDVHCGLTGAPETFVNVVFFENTPLRPGISHHIGANVRKGRTGEMNETLTQEMLNQLADVISVSNAAMEISLFEMPAQWIMEGGEILPEPGEEAFCEWLQKQQQEEREQEERELAVAKAS